MCLTISCQLILLLSCIALSKTFQVSLRKPLIEKQCVVSFSDRSAKRNAIRNSVSCIFMNIHEGKSLTAAEKTTEVEETQLDSLPPPPCSKSNKDDDIWRYVRQNIPIWVQNTWRDSGFIRFACDGLTVVAVPSILSMYQEALPNFLALTDFPVWLRRNFHSVFKLNHDDDKEPLISENSFQSLQYGVHPMQVAHLMRPALDDKAKSRCRRQNRLVVFIHGGAWGSGRPWMYRLVSLLFN